MIADLSEGVPKQNERGRCDTRVNLEQACSVSCFNRVAKGGPGRTGYDTHESAKCIDLADERALADAADGRVATHLADGRKLLSDEQGRSTRASTTGCRLTSSVTGADDEDVDRARRWRRRRRCQLPTLSACREAHQRATPLGSSLSEWPKRPHTQRQEHQVELLFC